MRNYDVQYKGRVIHRNISAEELATLVLEGQVSGLDSYAPTDRRTWRPVHRLIPTRNEEGKWEISEQLQSRVERAAGSQTRQEAPPVSAAALTAGPALPVGIYINSGPAGTGDSAKASAPPDRGAPAIMAVVGFALCAMSVIAAIGLITPDPYRKILMISGMLLALLGVLLSAIAVQYANRRMLSFVGITLGMIELVVWAGIIFQTGMR